jgi:hypothetical protein
MYMAASDNNITLDSSSYTGNVLASLPTTRVVAVTEEPQVLTWKPVNLGDFSYKTFGTDNADVEAVNLAIFGDCNTDGKFLVEIIHFVEALGTNLGNRSLSHSDPDGFAAITEAASQMSNSHTAHEDNDGADWLRAFGMKVSEALQQFTSSIPAAVYRAGGQYLARAAVQHARGRGNNQLLLD